MKNILITIIIIIASLNVFSQTDGDFNYLNVRSEMTYQGATLEEYIESVTAGDAITASDGITRDGDNFELGGELTKDISIEGSGYSLTLGETASRMDVEMNVTSLFFDIQNTLNISVDGKSWVVDGDYFINETNGDTLATLSEVRTLIDAAKTYQPFQYQYTYDATITDSRPGVGLFRLNNATYSLATYLYIDAFDYESVDKSNFIGLVDTGSVITIRDGANYVNYELSGGVISGGSYYKLGITYKNNFGVISDLCYVNFELNNNVGGSSSGGTLDSIYFSDQGIWINDTIPKSDSVRLSYTSDKLITDTVIIDNDTITGFTELKDAIEGESYSEINLDTATKAYTSGKLFFQGKTQSLSFYNDISGFTHNLGYENVRRVYNGTGALIENGKLIRKVGTYINGDVIASVDLAGCSTIDSARVYGMVTADILPGEIGIATRSGDVRELSNSGLNDTSAFLGFAGNVIDSCPVAPCLCTYIGEILISDNDSGQVDINIESPVYAPRPIVTAQFTEVSVNVTNPGTGLYGLITNATNNLYTVKSAIGFTVIGDSIRIDVSGNYDVGLAYSLYNSATQTDNYRIGIFVNGVKKFSMLRSVSNVSQGVNAYPQTLTLNKGDWVTTRIANLDVSTRNAVFNDGILKMIYLEK